MLSLEYRKFAIFFISYYSFLLYPSHIASAFNNNPIKKSVCNSHTNIYAVDKRDDDQTSRQIDLANKLLEDAKSMIVSLQMMDEVNSNDENIKSSSSKVASGNDSLKKKISYRDESTGLISTDGEFMAELSEDDEWEMRGLLNVFDTEEKSKVSNQLASRDVAASILNMRIKMHGPDYRSIFNSKNRFIGED